MASVGFALAAIATPVAAQSQSDVKPGEIVIMREVAPRNALIPGTGRPSTVDVKARPEWFGPLMSLGDQINDQEAANISGGAGSLGDPGAAPIPGMEALTGAQTLTTLNGGAERASAGGGLGGTISDTINGALGGAFGALPGGGRP